MNKFNYLLILLLLLIPSMNGFAAVPLYMNYQGYVEDAQGVPINGTGYFKFAIVNQAGDTAYWVNDGATMDGSEPPNPNYVTIGVSDGAFSVKLGDNSLANMAALTQSVFDSDSIYLRVWFSTDASNFERLASDIQIVSTGFAFKAANADRATVADQVTSVDWSDLTNVPADIADGDDGITSELDPTVPDTIKDGIDWSELSGIPSGFADGVDNGITSETDPTVPSTIKDGIDWSELSGIPAGFADGVDNGITSESDPQVGTLTNGSWCTTNGSTVNCTSAAPTGLWSQSSSNIYYNSGNVGIGTTAPIDPLHMVGNRLRIQFSSNQAAAGITTVPAADSGYTGLFWVTAADGTTYRANAHYDHTNQRLYVTNAGNSNLTGVYLANGDTAWTSTSDRRLKENITDTSYGLDTVLQIPVREFNFKSSPDKKKIGLIAQEVYPIVPEVVTKGDDAAEFTDTSTPWGVDYAGLTPVLIKSIQELQQIVATQQKLIEDQSREIESLKAAVGGL